MSQPVPEKQTAYFETNRAQIYCELWGEDHPGQAPILLIHGSTSTGQEDWGTVAPILARRWRVIIPDCRGHGRSTGTHTYRFAEMAADLAELVRHLGYDRVHIVGHSNGGNVALVMLVEHPEVVQTAVLQAANAYVSQDLIEREPVVFDPQRVEREAPEWKDSMIRLHGPVHGEAYWHELLALTLAETIAQPNYTPELLVTIHRPTLVIQGADDPVNAPSRHAQFIAAHISDAEAWIPKGVQHTVHEEIPAEWLTVVQSFLERRGDLCNDSLHRLKNRAYQDERDWIFDLHAAPASSAGKITLTGQVLTQAQQEAAVAAVRQAGDKRSALEVDTTGVSVLLNDNTPWALVNRNVTDLYEAPTIHSDRLSQGLLGESVRILETRDEWVKVRMQRDGYMGWAQAEMLLRCDENKVQAYLRSCTHRVYAELPQAWDTFETAGDPRRACGKLVFGCQAAVEETRNGYACIRLPDGRAWWLHRGALLEHIDWPKPDPAGITQTLDLVQRFVGVPYLWGGRSPFGYDCSGLTGAFWDFLGVTLPRDADQQRRAGVLVEGKPQPGDLLFFRRGTQATLETRADAVSHVALSLGAGRYLHASGTAWGTINNSLNPDDRDYFPELAMRFVDARRYIAGTNDIRRRT